MSRDFDVRVLGQLPLSTRVREQTDSGSPTLIADPESVEGRAFRETAWKIGAAQAAERVDHASKFGTIVVEGGA